MNKKLHILLINLLYSSTFSFPQGLKVVGITCANVEDSTPQGTEQ